MQVKLSRLQVSRDKESMSVNLVAFMDGLLLISYQAPFEELPLDLNLPWVDAGTRGAVAAL